MKEHKAYLPSKEACKNYTLFIDRDGVINKPIVNDYAKRPEDFVWCEGAIESIGKLKRLFKKVVLVTNQQGIGREIMSETDLEDIHLKMYNALKKAGVEYFNLALFAPYLRSENHPWRKPNNGMYIKAQRYFNDINFTQSIMVGDSPGDMELADSVGAIKVKISNPQFSFNNQDFEFKSLQDFVLSL
jgi:histidinol-phosphate phosphatase family protein